MTLSKQTDNLELVISYYVRNEYEDEYDEQYVPMALKCLISKFSNKTLPSNILTLEQEFKFLKIINAKLSNPLGFQLLFRASEHNYSAKMFHTLCDDKGATLTLIKSHGNIFGGYTSKSWTSTGDDEVTCVMDPNAFIFLVQSDDEAIQRECPLILNPKETHSECAVHHCDSSGPYFGCDDIWIHQDFNQNCVVTHISDSYDYGLLTGEMLCDGNESRKVLEYEVFKIL